MEDKVRKLLSRLEEIEQELGKPEALSDSKKYKELTQEHAYLTELRDLWEQYQKQTSELKKNKELLKEEKDLEFREMIQEEITSIEEMLPKTKAKLETLLVPPDPDDNRNVIMELRAGTGGSEAALFVGNCVRMYQLYADRCHWQVELLSCTPSEAGGYKEYIMVISGKNVYRFLKYEAGTHRVQRVPETESQGRVHTSAITVAVLLEPTEEEPIHIEEKDLRIDTYRASGAGGQHVNTTDSAVRITHLPTGIVVYCQEERSQHKNREKALRYLSAKLHEEQKQKELAERASLRSSQVGSGDRSERIRTYNFPQNRVTDHRINLTLYKLDYVMAGDLDPIVTPLVNHFHQEKLTS